jgi:hypothetical protein
MAFGVICKTIAKVWWWGYHITKIYMNVDEKTIPRSAQRKFTPTKM